MKDLNIDVVQSIQAYIEEKRKTEHIVNEVVREDVFAILQSQCTVLYYDLEDDVEGCHLIKPVNGVCRQFVFINTSKNVQEQVWTAAHELGHVWKVDQHIAGQFPNRNFDAETIIGRFAAEFLMPFSIFHNEVKNKLQQFKYHGTQMYDVMIMDLIAYLMNYFCTPYKSIVWRFIELGYIQPESESIYLNYEDSDLLNRCIRENQYSRLGKKQSACVIENLAKDLHRAEESQSMHPNKIARLRQLFHIQDTASDGTKLGFKG